MGLSIKHAETSTFLSGMSRQPLRERHVCSNVKDDIPQQRCKEGRPQQRHPHARTVSHGKIHSARYVARPAGQDPAEENRPAVKDKEGQGQSKLLRMHRKGNVESSSCRPTATVTSSTAAVSQSTFEDSIGAPQGLGDGRRRTSAGTMHAVTSGDVRVRLAWLLVGSVMIWTDRLPLCFPPIAPNPKSQIQVACNRNNFDFVINP